MKKTLLPILLLSAVLILVCLTGCASDRSEDAGLVRSELTAAYDRMLYGNLAVTYMIFGNSEPRKIYVEFGKNSSGAAVFGATSELSGNDASINTFALTGGYWYLDDGNKKIAVSADRLSSSLWLLDMDFVDYEDLLECISPSVILREGFSADKFGIIQSGDILSSVFSIRLNSSYFGKKELFVNDIPEARLNELLSYEGSLVYRLARSGVMKEITLEFRMTFRALAEPISVKVILRPITSVTALSAEERNLYNAV